MRLKMALLVERLLRNASAGGDLRLHAELNREEFGPAALDNMMLGQAHLRVASLRSKTRRNTPRQRGSA